MQSLANIRAIVFDAYGTLFNVQSLTDRLHTHFGDKAGKVNDIWRQKQLVYTWLRSLMQQYQPFSEVTAQALRFACQTLNLPLPPSVEHDLVQGYYQLSAYPEVGMYLQRLSKISKLAILSNANPGMLEAAVQNSQFQSYLDAILSVDPIQAFKPDPRVYQLAEQHLQLRREEIAFVSSNTWDVSGAKSFGFFAVWLNRGNTVMDTLGYEPNLEISDLSQLESWIQQTKD